MTKLYGGKKSCLTPAHPLNISLMVLRQHLPPVYTSREDCQLDVTIANTAEDSGGALCFIAIAGK